MRKRWIPVLVVAVLALSVALVAGCSSKSTTTTPTTPKTTPSTSSSSKVSIVDFAFNPSTLTVAVGTTVTWTNNGATAHTVTGPDWDSGQIQPGSTFTHTFNTAGTFAYHCSIHPTQMNGQIIVGSSGTSSGTSGSGTTTTTPSSPSPGY